MERPLRLALLALVAAVTAGGLTPTALLELNGGNYEAELGRLDPNTPVLLECYSHYCPACKRFQPEFETAAAELHMRQADGHPQVIVARLDCAVEGLLCSALAVKHYPQLYFGRAEDVRRRQVASLVGIELSKRESTVLIQAVDQALVELRARLYAPPEDGAAEEARLADEARGFGVGAPKPPPRRDPHAQQADISDVLLATLQSWEYMASSLSMQGSSARSALADWLALLARAHPHASCRSGASGVVQDLNRLWPAHAERPEAELARRDLCPGSGRPEEWSSLCASAGARGGYTCGLWTLFHTLAARVGGPLDERPSSSPGQDWLQAVRGFVAEFFQCSECQAHFAALANMPDADAVRTSAQARVWAWRKHNAVNSRLREEALAEQWDRGHVPRDLPRLWPLSEQCPECRLPRQNPADADNPDRVQWDESAVLLFLEKYYRLQNTQVPLRQTTAVRPLGRGALQVGGAPNLRAGWTAAAALVGSFVGLLALVLGRAPQYRFRAPSSVRRLAVA